MVRALLFLQDARDETGHRLLELYDIPIRFASQQRHQEEERN